MGNKKVIDKLAAGFMCIYFSCLLASIFIMLKRIDLIFIKELPNWYLLIISILTPILSLILSKKSKVIIALYIICILCVFLVTALP